MDVLGPHMGHVMGFAVVGPVMGLGLLVGFTLGAVLGVGAILGLELVVGMGFLLGITVGPFLGMGFAMGAGPGLETAAHSPGQRQHEAFARREQAHGRQPRFAWRPKPFFFRQHTARQFEFKPALGLRPECA